MAGSRKKAIVRKLDGGLLFGYLTAPPLLDPTASPLLHLLDLEARILPVRLAEVAYVAFVRDFNLADPVDPERLTRRIFPARPRAEGLWLRLTLRDGSLLEGLAAVDATLADGFIQDHGLYLAPPDARLNTQRLFVPRTAFTDMLVLAVITSPSKKKAETDAQTKIQQRLFQEDPPIPESVRARLQSPT